MKIRKPSVAGMFYPDNKEELNQTLENLFQIAEKENSEKFDSKIAGIIAPHAGYVYSGKTAAIAYSKLKGKNYKTVVVISPSHNEFFPGVSYYDGDFYETPLGQIPINKEIRKELTYNSKYIFESEIGHGKEHALEVHLPFLQYVLGNSFDLVPLVMGDQKEGFINELANMLWKINTKDTLIVASSDLSHYYSVKDAEFLDSRVEKRITEFEPDLLLKDVNRKLAEACGTGPMVALMKAMKSKLVTNSKVLYRTNSGEVSQDFHQVVGYLSAVFY